MDFDKQFTVPIQKCRFCVIVQKFITILKIGNELFNSMNKQKNSIRMSVKMAIEYSPTHRDALVVKLAFLRMETKKIIKFLQHKYFGRIS